MRLRSSACCGLESSGGEIKEEGKYAFCSIRIWEFSYRRDSEIEAASSQSLHWITNSRGIQPFSRANGIEFYVNSASWRPKFKIPLNYREGIKGDQRDFPNCNILVLMMELPQARPFGTQGCSWSKLILFFFPFIYLFIF